MSAIRLYVDRDLGPDAAVPLTPAQAHYLAGVMRRSVGDDVLLFNGRDGEWRAEISDLSRGRRGAALAREQTRPQTGEPDLWLLFAPIKRTPMEYIARCATELGVTALMPVITRHTTTGRVKTDRLAAIAIEAAEQCGRLSLPVCGEPVPLARLLSDWPDDRHLLLCDETGGGAPMAAALKDAAPGPWAVIIGPEGGFARDEIETMAAMKNTVRVSLGPTILRADTAAITALACLQALTSPE